MNTLYELTSVFRLPEQRTLLQGNYFDLISASEYYQMAEIRSKNTGHFWAIKKKGSEILLYHKYRKKDFHIVKQTYSFDTIAHLSDDEQTSISTSQLKSIDTVLRSSSK